MKPVDDDNLLERALGAARATPSAQPPEGLADRSVRAAFAAPTAPLADFFDELFALARPAAGLACAAAALLWLGVAVTTDTADAASTTASVQTTEASRAVTVLGALEQTIGFSDDSATMLSLPAASGTRASQAAPETP